MHIERLEIPVTTDAGGAATVYSPVVAGRVLQLRYVPHATTPLDTGADVTATGEVSGVAVATLSNIGTAGLTKAIRQATHDITGAASLFAAGGQAVNEPVHVAGERIKFIVAQGGDTKSGTFHLWIG